MGFQCVDCIRADRQSVPAARTVAGATLRTRTTPVVTYALIAVNVAVFAITAAQAGGIVDNDRSALFYSWALWPPAVADGQLFRLIGSGFLHFGPLHLAVNMFALWIVGRDVEQVLGRSRYLAVYAASILGGSAAVMVFALNSVTAGASGAVYGLFGALGVILLRLRQNLGPIVAIIVINLVISVATPGISLWGHLGGLAAGTVATAGLLFAPGWLRSGSKPGTQRVIGWAAVAVVCVIALVVIAVRISAIRQAIGL